MDIQKTQTSDLAASIQELSLDDGYVIISPFTTHGVSSPLVVCDYEPPYPGSPSCALDLAEMEPTRGRCRPLPECVQYAVALETHLLNRSPPKWSNDWHCHMASGKWHVYYGGMRWWFNEVLHVPGEPILLLFSQDNGRETGGDRELIEVDGRFFLNTTSDYFMERTTVSIEGNPTRETVLAGLHGEVSVLYGEEWARDELAFINQEV
ncbi:hypothetical protein FRB95_007627 [Tulasnella sp. JGI-2019a]|nr:hypothetical protein FRB95_007627 [Tulasnella sp. JGI-2019a]